MYCMYCSCHGYLVQANFNLLFFSPFPVYRNRSWHWHSCQLCTATEMSCIITNWAVRKNSDKLYWTPDPTSMQVPRPKRPARKKVRLILTLMGNQYRRSIEFLDAAAVVLTLMQIHANRQHYSYTFFLCLCLVHYVSQLPPELVIILDVYQYSLIFWTVWNLFLVIRRVTLLILSWL